jgi:dTDP-4-amino-4,6-dideoxygalactose transaminase
MNVPFFDFKLAPSNLRSEWQTAIERVIASGRFIGGPEVTDFETRWAGYLGIAHAVGVANGLDAITIGLKALGIGPGSHVAVPSHTFLATWLAIAAVGAEPVGVDCDVKGLLDVDALIRIEGRIDAVIPVHMHGQMVDMPKLCAWAQARGVKIIEDCAQAHGARINNQHAGTWGDIGAFSFYPTKNLGALGDAGVIVTSNPTLAEAVRSFGNYGSTPTNKYKYARAGVNSRLDPIQAAVLDVNLNYLDTWNARRREIATSYIFELSKFGIEMLNSDPESSVWHHFIVLCDNRDGLRSDLLSENIHTEIHYPESAEDSYSEISTYISGAPLNSRAIAKRTLSLPMSPWMTDEQVLYVLDRITSDRILRNFRGEI